MKLYVTRHGQTDWNYKGLLQGNTDIPLNKMGEFQARNLKNKLDNVNFDLCITSPLTRASTTTSIICESKIPIIKDKRLKERNLGDLEGKDSHIFDAKLYWNYNINSNDNGVERVQDLFERVNSFLNDLKKYYKDFTILVVAHGAVVRTLNFAINGYDENTNFLEFDVPNCSIFEYEI